MPSSLIYMSSSNLSVDTSQMSLFLSNLAFRISFCFLLICGSDGHIHAFFSVRVYWVQNAFVFIIVGIIKAKGAKNDEGAFLGL